MQLTVRRTEKGRHMKRRRAGQGTVQHSLGTAVVYDRREYSCLHAVSGSMNTLSHSLLHRSVVLSRLRPLPGGISFPGFHGAFGE